MLKQYLIETPLGEILAVSDDKALHSLEFIDENKKIKQEKTSPIEFVETELKAYFEGKLKEFKTPLHLMGTPFQKNAWQALQCIPYGETRSYAQQAKAIKKETAYRAVANANGANRFVIVIPCHRIINSNGELGGYAAGIHRKKWLIEHEKLNSDL